MITLTPEQDKALKENRVERYEFEITDENGMFKRRIEAEGNISVDTESEVVRGASFLIRGDWEIDWMLERIRPVMCLQMPDGEWARWKKGRYMFMSPLKQIRGRHQSYEADCMDESAKLQMDSFAEGRVFLSGTKYTSILASILVSCGFQNAMIGASDAVIQADVVLDDSQSKLKWFNELCDQINFRHLYLADNGVPTAIPWKMPDAGDVKYTYMVNDESVILPQMDIGADYWNLPNVIRRTVSRPDMEPLIAERINDDPVSMLSTVRRGVKVVDSQTLSMVDSQEQLQEIVNRVMYQARQIEQTVTFSTLNMPHHEVYDVVELVKKDAVNGVFLETGWEMDLYAGATMRHTLERVVL